MTASPVDLGQAQQLTPRLRYDAQRVMNGRIEDTLGEAADLIDRLIRELADTRTQLEAVYRDNLVIEKASWSRVAEHARRLHARPGLADRFLRDSLDALEAFDAAAVLLPDNPKDEQRRATSDTC